jgi:hypothetical protein
LVIIIRSKFLTTITRFMDGMRQTKGGQGTYGTQEVQMIKVETEPQKIFFQLSGGLRIIDNNSPSPSQGSTLYEKLDSALK